jgi:phosphomannomutase
MTKIKFGTDGWRAIIAKEFTVDNVARVSCAVSAWLKKNFENPSVVLGHDCRFGGELFVETATKVFVHNSIKVFLAKDFVSTPMISLGTLKLGASLGVIITASHNPPSYNGYKLKGHFGGPLMPDDIQAIEDIIPETHGLDLDNIEIKKAFIADAPLEQMYIDHVKANFNLDLIRNAGLHWAYDAMYGAGQRVMKNLFPDITFLHCEYNPSFHGQAPEPIHKNLLEFSNLIKTSGKINCGLCTDGDADRIGLYDSTGNFVDSHHIILLLIKYLVEVKKYTGKVVVAFSVTPRFKKLCEHFGLEYEVTKIGFKYIAGHMITEDVLLGGEESGGIAIKGHIPERDGIWMGLTLWEYMASEGKTLEQLIEDLYKIVGTFQYERDDLHITETLKQNILKNCNSNAYKSFGAFEVKNLETIDGFKYYFDNDEWLMIRASGTEPVLRLYAETANAARTRQLLDAAKAVLIK